MMKINFNGFTGKLKPMLYHNERTICLYLIDPVSNQPILTVTANPMGFVTPYGSLPIKNYSENQGIYQAMRKHEIIDRYTHSVAQGHTDILIAPMRPRLKQFVYDELIQTYADFELTQENIAEICGLKPERS